MPPYSQLVVHGEGPAEQGDDPETQIRLLCPQKRTQVGNRVRARRPGFPNLPRVHHEVLAENRQTGGAAGGDELTLGRLPGWIANWREMHLNPKRRICRPRQIYTGETERDVVPVEKR